MSHGVSHPAPARLVMLEAERLAADPSVRIEAAAAEYSADPQAIACRAIECGLPGALRDLKARRRLSAAWGPAPPATTEPWGTRGRP